MRCFLAICAATFSLTCVALAAEPTGEWLVASGDAHIRIDDCNGILWGIISWEKDPGGLDEYNPNPAERTRPLLGSHVLLAMRPNNGRPGRWDGEVYNAENGKTYTSHLSLASPDVLRIEGCVLGFLCGGENWTRLKTEAERTAPARIPAPPPPPRGARSNQAPPLPAPARTACSGVTNGSGATH
jgi:uncharacterized protein (DUF2147 family)